MTINDYIKALESLPKGNLTHKVIRGKQRMYLQWTEDGKRRSRYIRKEDEAFVLSQIERRHQIEALIRSHSYEKNHVEYTYAPAIAPMNAADSLDAYDPISVPYPWACSVTTGQLLQSMTANVRRFDKRSCYGVLQSYLGSDEPGRVCILYGLRRTGKTTMLFQAISELPASQTAYIKITASDTMADLNQDLRLLSARGYLYVFIDEVTLLRDFIDSASLLSDIYAQAGMKIVLSGTDSLGFALSSEDELYDRAVMIHTTPIPFSEYSRLTGINDIDEYIRYGGTLSPAGNVAYDAPGRRLPSAIKNTFEDDVSVRRYIDTAVAHNIQHSLINYRYGSHFRHLIELYEANELTNAVNRVIEDINHRFLLSVLIRDWESHDLGSARQLLRKEAAERGETSILDLIDTGEVTGRVKSMLEILNKNESKVALTEDHVSELKEYLYMLDLIADCPSESIGAKNKEEHIIVTQPGMRYVQAQMLIDALLKDDYFSAVSAVARKAAEDRILEDVRGRMLEDIVLFETVRSLPRGTRAFKLLFAAGEIDMVVYDANDLTCRLYEVKHSTKRDPMQYRHLTDPDKLAAIKHRYGEVISGTVLYRGEPCSVESDASVIEYMNVEDYLRALPKL